MPRSARAWEPGDVLSIVGRAHEGRRVFGGALRDHGAVFQDRYWSRPCADGVAPWARLTSAPSFAL